MTVTPDELEQQCAAQAMDSRHCPRPQFRSSQQRPPVTGSGPLSRRPVRAPRLWAPG